MLLAMGESLGLDPRALDRARVSRDPRFDGKFFIAVTSTGIYCRPICPVRSPKRVNIRYYRTAAAAAEAGFRPCLRCRPEAAPGTPAWTGTCAVVRRALRLIDGGFLDRDGVDALAERLGMGVRHLDRLFAEHVGASPLAVAQTRRLHFAKRLLDETRLPITQIAVAAGFGSVRRFNDAFQRTYARPPRDLRKRQRSAPTGGDTVLRLAFRPPYDWSQVRDFLAARAVPGVERVGEREYARTVACEGGYARISVRPLDDDHALELRVHGAPPTALFALSSAARRMFDLSCDPGPIVSALRQDALLSPIVRRHPGLRIPGTWEPFECAVRAIVGQQVTVAGGRTLLARLVARAGQPVSGGAPGLTHLFPDATMLASADLDGLGLTTARVRALRALAAAVLGGLDLNASAVDVVAALVELPGVGAWTAQYVALRGLGDPDAFPASDLVLRQAAAAGDTPLTTRALEERAESWRPWRGYATVHLWSSMSAASASRQRRHRRPVMSRARS